MSVVADIEKQALSLPDQERAKLANRLIASPPDFTYDEVIEEAMRRNREMDADPSKAITLDQLDEMIKNRRARE